MPYFNSKARKIFRNAKGDPSKAGPLARWARDAHDRAKTGPKVEKTGVIVARDGTILAHTAQQGWTGGPTARYTTAVVRDEHRTRDVVDTEAGMALAALERLTGQRCIEVTYSQVCTGQAETGSEEIGHERMHEIAVHLGKAGADVAEVVEYAGTGTDDDGEYLELCDGTRMRRGDWGGWYTPGWSKHNDPERAAYASVRRDLPSDNW